AAGAVDLAGGDGGDVAEVRLGVDPSFHHHPTDVDFPCEGLATEWVESDGGGGVVEGAGRRQGSFQVVVAESAGGQRVGAPLPVGEGVGRMAGDEALEQPVGEAPHVEALEVHGQCVVGDLAPVG